MKNLTIALDYDGTYTADPYLFGCIIRRFLSRNHSVSVVTARSGEDDKIPNDHEFTDIGVKIVYCDGKPKRDFIKADIWIDDDPAGIYLGSPATPALLDQWRAGGRKGRIVAD